MVLLFYCSAMHYASAQNKKIWLQYGDDAFKQGDYASAAYFYSKIIDKNSNEAKDLVFPYEPTAFTIPLKKEKKNANDTTINSVGNIPNGLNQPDSGLGSEEQKLPTSNSHVYGFKMQYVTHQLAESYRLDHNYEKAETWYAHLLQESSTQEMGGILHARYWYAISLMKNGKYDLAIKQFVKYQEENTDKQSYFYQRAKKGEMSCYFALDPKSVRQGTTIIELDTMINFVGNSSDGMNSGSASFAPNFFGDNSAIVFTSTRKIMGKTDLLYQCDLYVSEKSDTANSSSVNIWTAPSNMNSPVNTSQHEGAGVLSPDKQKFFFTRWTTIHSGKKECAIYMSRSVNGQWMQPMKLNVSVNADGYRSMHPSFNLDGSILFFSSDRPGGQGKMDIWGCSMDEFGNAGNPFNLGPVINTSEDEGTPYYEYRTQTLYFSSDGHIGLGGLDIFKSYRQEEDTLWSPPINLGAPINSSRDDNFYVISHDQTARYFSSDRKSCSSLPSQKVSRGISSCEGGNCMRIYYAKGDPILITLKGKVLNKETKKPLPNTLITIKDIDENLQPFYLITNDMGEYSVLLHEDMDYFIKVQKNRFFGNKATISSIGILKSTDIVQDFILEPIPGGEIVLKGIEYDYDKATLRPVSKKILDILYEMLALNDNLIVELSSHTDSRGSDEYNMKLSQERAASCVDYLVAKGIPKERLVAQGYGETKPLVPDNEINKMKTAKAKEEAHQKNRRTAISILKEEAIRSE